MSLISPLVSTLQSQGIKLSDKSIQALSVAGYEVKERQYEYLYDDNLLNGLVKTNSICTGLFESFGLNELEIIKDVYLPLGQDFEYRRRIDQRMGDKRRKRLEKRAVKAGTTSTVFGSYHWYDDREDILASLPNTVTSYDLLLLALSKPAVFEVIKRNGVSINKIKRYAKTLKIYEPDIETQKYIVGLRANKLTLDAFDYSTSAKIQELSDDGYIESAVRSNIIVTERQSMAEKIKELEWLINKHDISEFDLQKFFERNPSFLLSTDHIRAHAQLSLVREDLGDLKPDFFLERIEGCFCDILDIKLPKENIVVGKNNRRTFSSAVASAVGQLREYRNYFDDRAHRDLFTKRYGLESYKPDITVVIGRSSSFSGVKERQALSQELANLNILTYDDIYSRAKRQLQLMI